MFGIFVRKNERWYIRRQSLWSSEPSTACLTALDSFRMISLLIHFQLQQTDVSIVGMQLGLREYTALLKAILADD